MTREAILPLNINVTQLRTTIDLMLLETKSKKTDMEKQWKALITLMQKIETG